MVRKRLLVLPLTSILTVLGASCAPRSLAAAAQEEHAHDPTSVTVFGERLLLFLEHPHLVRGSPARFLAHFTVLATGEALRTGSVTLELGPTRLAAETPKRDGLFVPEGSPSEAGTFAARLIVTGDQAEETLDLGPIVVHASQAEADRAAQARSVDEPANAVPFLMEPQWKVKLLLARAESRTLRERLLVPARVVAPEGRSARVSAPVTGRLVAPRSGTLAGSGERVEAGQTLALVEPPLGAAELAQVRALELEFELKALEVLSAASEAEARLEFAGRERERIARLRTEGLGTQQELDRTEQELALARTGRDSALRMKSSLDALLAARGGGAAPRFALEAPVAGTIVEVLEVPGTSVEAGTAVFRILDASRVWIEGRVSEFDLVRLGEDPRATVRLAALPAREFELRGPAGGRPYFAPEVEEASRTLLVRYELDNPDGALRPGMLAELGLATGEREAAVVIPLEGVVMDQGLPTAYVMLEGELFQKRELELGLRDGDRVEVLRGLERGERVATRGAYVIKLAALSPASFGAGHAH